MRTDQRFVSEHAPPRQVDDWLENHPEALVTKRLVEGPRRCGNGIGRVHEKQSSRTVQLRIDPMSAYTSVRKTTWSARRREGLPRQLGQQVSRRPRLSSQPPSGALRRASEGTLNRAARAAGLRLRLYVDAND
jgi:hypothetical protein